MPALFPRSNAEIVLRVVVGYGSGDGDQNITSSALAGYWKIKIERRVHFSVKGFPIEAKSAGE